MVEITGEGKGSKEESKISEEKCVCARKPTHYFFPYLSSSMIISYTNETNPGEREYAILLSVMYLPEMMYFSSSE